MTHREPGTVPAAEGQAEAGDGREYPVPVGGRSWPAAAFHDHGPRSQGQEAQRGAGSAGPDRSPSSVHLRLSRERKPLRRRWYPDSRHRQ
jgi:hypothetical protein